MLELMFWLVALLTAYSYFLYPIALVMVVRLMPNRRLLAAITTPTQTSLPEISLIVTAYNESGRIRQKIDDCLQIDYPELDIIVASDCSTDNTDSVVDEYANRGVRLIRATEHRGKENAQRCAIEQARGSILIFSDVATRIPAAAIKHLATYFVNPQIGAVSSEDRFLTQSGELAGEGAYVKYEMWLRRLESQAAGLVGLSGSFFAARKEICCEWDIHSPSDFNTALNCARAGFRTVTAPDVAGYYKDLKDPQKEYQRKVRTVLRGITAIARHSDVLSFSRFGLFAFQVWSHKILRWAVAWLLPVLFLLSLFLVIGDHPFYQWALVGQSAFYGVAMLAHVYEPAKRNSIVRIVYFFVQANIGIADACLQFWSGKRMTTWQPSAR